MPKTAIMIDLETLSTSTDATILSIGAVRFDPYGYDVDILDKDKFYEIGRAHV